MPLRIVRNDITNMQVDAIVNAANETLLGGGGVDGCIHRAAGPELKAACADLGGCRVGEAKLTGGFALPCRYVIHTVGPVWQGGQLGEREALASCYRSALMLAQKRGCETVAFPLISSGAYGYPKDQALRVAIDTISGFLMDHDITVYLVIFDKRSFQLSEKLFRDMEAYIDDHYVAAAESRELSRNSPRRLMGKMSHYGATAACAPAALPRPVSRPQSLEEALGQMDESFSQMLLRTIDQRGLKDSQVYKKANIDRKLFSKIRKDPFYKPSKPTVLAFAIALELPLGETKELLMKAGYALSSASKFDIIVEYFIRQHQYDIFLINEALFYYDQSLLGG